MFCSNPIGVFCGYNPENHSIVAGKMPCNSWQCPDCQKHKKRVLYARIFNGPMSLEAVPKYGLKFLTLTYPGTDRRKGRMPYEIYEEMSEAFHKTFKMVKRLYGKFHYFRVVEPQRDGTPHFHILLVGKNVIPKKILDTIRHFWSTVYLMGFVKIRWKPFENRIHAIRYMLKYITKDIKKIGHYKRLFTASRGALAETRKGSLKSVVVEMGQYPPSETITIPLPKTELLTAFPGKRKRKIPFVRFGSRFTDPEFAKARIFNMLKSQTKKFDKNYNPLMPRGLHVTKKDLVTGYPESCFYLSKSTYVKKGVWTND